MTTSSLLSTFCLLVALITESDAAAFLSHNVGTASRQRLTKTEHVSSTATFLQVMIPDGSEAFTSSTSTMLTNNLNNFLVATIDADIANVSDNEFAPIFAGGILVMCGGVLSALIVGFILDSRDLYANVVADSYAQGADDEEFWKGLSDEEKKKTQELLAKLKDSKEGETGPSLVKEAKSEMQMEQSKNDVPSPSQAVQDPTPAKDSKDAGMFSDY